jgi:hypothetical protein
MTPQEMRDEAERLVGMLWYYEAAEGEQWFKEAAEREDTQRRYDRIRADLQALGEDK